MYKRVHHQIIGKLLDVFDAGVLRETQCFFGGGTAIALMLDEYRESVDVDFLCASREGYRALRNIVTQNSLGTLLREPVTHVREVRADRDGIRTFLQVDGRPVKVEIVREGRIDVSGEDVPGLPVPVLSRADLYAEKLLANADRWNDRSQMSRDIIDLAMMVEGWGEIPELAWQKTREAYGASVDRAYRNAVALMGDERYLASCLEKMHMAPDLSGRIGAALKTAPQSIEPGSSNSLEP